MNSLIYLFRFLYRIRYWLIICPILVTFIVAMKLKSGSRGHNYSVTTTIYTGVVSGYDIERSQPPGLEHHKQRYGQPDEHHHIQSHAQECIHAAVRTKSGTRRC